MYRLWQDVPRLKADNFRDRIKLKNLLTVYLSNDKMIADLMTKSVMGKLFVSLRSRMFGTST